MNKKRGIFFGFAVLLTAAIFTFAGCGDIFDSSSKGDDDDDSTSNSGNNGSTAPSAPSTLTITGIPAEHNGKFVAAFDSEEAPTIVALADNTGKAQQIKNRSVTLSVFSVVDGDLTNLTPYTGNGYVTMRLGIFNTAEPGEDSFVDGTDITVSFTNGGATARYLNIDDDDNDDDDDAGRLTITGLAGYEGMRVYAQETPVGGHIISTPSRFGVIENGSATLSVYDHNGDKYTPYKGNDKNVTINVSILSGDSAPYEFIAAATITVSFTNGNATVACDPSSIVELTSGTLTITGIPATYNGKSVIANGHKGELYLSASSRYEDEEPVIENGSVTLDMFYKIGEDGYSYTFYKGNDQDVPMEVVILAPLPDNSYRAIAYADITVSFTKGSATVACDSSSFIDLTSAGRLTITGLAAYEGKHVRVKDSTGKRYLYAYEDEEPVIENGSITLLVSSDEDRRSYTSLYRGNDQDVSMEVEILNGDGSDSSPYQLIAITDITVSFTKGSATVACDSSSIIDADDVSRLTITGLAAYEGKRVRAEGHIGELDINAGWGDDAIIENGSITLYMSSEEGFSYRGNDQDVSMEVLIFAGAWNDTWNVIASVPITVSFTKGHAIVDCSSSLFTDRTSTGRLTITGLADYEGKRVRARGSIGELNLMADITRSGGVQPIIENGSVAFGVSCSVGVGYSQPTLYTGNDRDVSMRVWIDDDESNMTIAILDITVSFTDGSDTVAITP
jgi:hypothetical protein